MSASHFVFICSSLSLSRCVSWHDGSIWPSGLTQYAPLDDLAVSQAVFPMSAYTIALCVGFLFCFKLYSIVDGWFELLHLLYRLSVARHLIA